MLNRRHIRIKVMQTLYAFNLSEGDNLKPVDKFLLQSLEDMYDLHLSLLALLIEVHKRAEDYYTKSQNKLLVVAKEEKVSRKFSDNEVLKAIRENKFLESKLESNKDKFWYLDFEYIDIIFKDILKSEIYKKYVETSETNFKGDKQFIIEIFSEVIANNEQLYDYFEDKKLTWIDDLPVINTGFLKLLKKLKPQSPETFWLPSLYKDEEDRDFAISLLRKVILNKPQYNTEIAERTTNWDSDRIAKMDKVLLQMALCEFQCFTSIPYKVTINEYLEIAKEYSTNKSSMFINGILDKIVKDYHKKNIHQKVGRGLL